MSKIYIIKVCAIIFVLATTLILPSRGNSQTDNKIKSKRAKINNSSLQQNKIKKTIKPQRQLPNSMKLSTQVTLLEKKLSLAKTELTKTRKSESKKDGEIKFLRKSLDNLRAQLLFQSDLSKNYKELINCYRTALFTWDDLNRRQGLTEQEHLVIGFELRRSLFACPPVLEQ